MFSIRTIQLEQTQRESLQRDYVFLLQTVLSTDETRLFGGKKVRFEFFLRFSFFGNSPRFEASRSLEKLTRTMSTTRSVAAFVSKVKQKSGIRPEKTDFRSYSLEGSGLYVDNYGFKHDRADENDRLQYICVKLAQFYQTKSQIIDEKVYRTNLKQFLNNSIPSVGKRFSFSFRSRKNRRFSFSRKISNRWFDEEFRFIFAQNFGKLSFDVTPNKLEKTEDLAISKIFVFCCPILMFVRFSTISFRMTNRFFSSQLNPKFEKQISLDLHRTMPNNIRFSGKDSEGVRFMRQNHFRKQRAHCKQI